MAANADNQNEHFLNPAPGWVTKILWLLAAAAALLLAMATVDLAASVSASRGGTGVTAYLTGGPSITLLREAPSRTAGVAAIIGRGESAEIIGRVTTQNTVWLQVKTASGSGWVPAEQVSFEPPDK